MIDYFKRNLLYKQDFPKAGVRFADVASLLIDPFVLPEWQKYVEKTCSPTIVQQEAPSMRIYTHAVPPQILAVDGRGLIFGSTAAVALQVPLRLARKKGKLPYEYFEESFTSEYGAPDSLCGSSYDTCPPGADHRIVVVDDILATGSTAFAAVSLARKMGWQCDECIFLGVIAGLPGRTILETAGIKVHAMLGDI